MNEPSIGHNSVTQVAADQLRSVLERVERVEFDMKALSDDRSDIYKEAAGNGYDVKALRIIVRMRKQDPAKRAEQEAILESYQQALGML